MVNDSLWVDDLKLGVLEARLAMAGQWATNSSDPLDIRTGLIYSGYTTLMQATEDTSPMTVDVHEFGFIATKGRSNGPYQGCSSGMESVNLPAPPSLGSKRTDLVWVIQRDKNAVINADANTLAELGVTQGTSTTGTPAKPALPAGATEVGTVTYDCTSAVPTKTSDAQVTLTTSGRWTALRGMPIPVRSSTERDAITTYLGLRVLRLDLGGIIETYDSAGWRGARKSYTPVWAADGGGAAKGTDGVLSGEYVETGDMVDAVIYFKLGTSGQAQGTGNYSLTLPVAARTTDPFALNGTAIYNASGKNFILAPSLLDATRIRLVVDNSSTVWNQTNPDAITTGATVRVSVRYRRA